MAEARKDAILVATPLDTEQHSTELAGSHTQQMRITKETRCCGPALQIHEMQDSPEDRKGAEVGVKHVKSFNKFHFKATFAAAGPGLLQEWDPGSGHEDLLWLPSH